MSGWVGGWVSLPLSRPSSSRFEWVGGWVGGTYSRGDLQDLDAFGQKLFVRDGEVLRRRRRRRKRRKSGCGRRRRRREGRSCSCKRKRSGSFLLLFYFSFYSRRRSSALSSSSFSYSSFSFSPYSEGCLGCCLGCCCCRLFGFVYENVVLPILHLFGWVDGWVSCSLMIRKMEENEAVGMSYCEMGVGGWMGGCLPCAWRRPLRELRGGDGRGV